MTTPSDERYPTLEARYIAETSPPPDDLEVPQAFHYIRYKAFVYLQLGPAEYRAGDALGQPPEGWPEEAYGRLAHGCQQILDWRGLSSAQPIEGLGIRPFYLLFRMFHFSCAEQSLIGHPDGMLDCMSMQHVVEGHEIDIFNLTPKPGTEAPTPCPYCGEPLRTSRARQCRACGTDWHDPDNITRRQSPL